MIGQCFAFSNTNEFRNNRKITPLEGKPFFYGRDGWVNGYDFGSIYAEAGMALHYDETSQTKYWGAPGMWNWTGTFAL